jgi:hypothetical protein
MYTKFPRTLYRYMEKTKTSRTGRRRWAELIRFLKTTMQTAKSEKVRMSAALRLASILELREQRELLELKAAIRASEKESVPASNTGTTAPESNEAEHTPVLHPEKMQAVWNAVLSKGRSDG